LTDYYDLLNDLAPPGMEDGANFFDFVSPRLPLGHREQVSRMILAFIPDLWDEFDHQTAGELDFAGLKKLCK